MKYIFTILILSNLFFYSFAQDAVISCQQSKIRQFNSLMKAKQINYPGDPNYDVKYYKLDLSLTFIPQNIKGDVTVNALITSDNVSSVFLDLVDTLMVDSVKLNNAKTTYTHQNDKLNINLNAAHNVGDPISIVVYYHGIPGTSGFGSFTFGYTPLYNSPTIYTLSEPYGAKDWWPCKDTPADKADSADVWITVSTDMIPASNGTLIGIIDNGNGTHTYKWKVSYPIAQYLLSLAIANYHEYVNYYNYSHTDSMPITNYIYNETWNSNTKYLLDLTPEMIKVFAEHFGEYPFLREKYGHAQFGWGGGMEHQTITSLGSFSTGIISHELAHMWYGDAITCKDWHHIWLNEGFATYGQGVWIESQQGKSGYNDFINSEMSSAKLAVGSIWVENINDVNQIFNGNRSYAKGGVVLHMLRGIVGDSVFYDILKSYSSDPALAYGVATTEDFQRVAEQVSGLDLDYFFYEWIYGYNYPKYSIVWNKNSLSGEQWNLSLKISQQVNTNPTYFTMPLQIKINFTSGDTLITIFNNAQNQNFDVSLNKEPVSIIVDPDNWILKDIISVSTGVKEQNTPTTFELEQNYPNPFNPTTKIIWQSPISTHQTLKVYNILGNEVSTLVDEFRPAGRYEINFDGSDLASGVYIYKLTAGDFTSSRKMILIR